MDRVWDSLIVSHPGGFSSLVLSHRIVKISQVYLSIPGKQVRSVSDKKKVPSRKQQNERARTKAVTGTQGPPGLHLPCGTEGQVSWGRIRNTSRLEPKRRTGCDRSRICTMPSEYGLILFVCEFFFVCLCFASVFMFCLL